MRRDSGRREPGGASRYRLELGSNPRHGLSQRSSFAGRGRLALDIGLGTEYTKARYGTSMCPALCPLSASKQEGSVRLGSG